jgi:hypothetical protein
VGTELDDWLAASAIDRGKLFHRANKVARTWGDGMTVKAVWHLVKESAKHIGVAKLSPHDLRRTCVRLLPCFARRVAADPIPFGVRFGSNDGGLPCVQTAGFDQPSMMALASSRILEPGARLWKDC